MVARHYGRRGPASCGDVSHVGVRARCSPGRSSTTAPGVVGVVSPWNYPLSLAVTDALPALLAGQRRGPAPRPPGLPDRPGGGRAPGRGRRARRACCRWSSARGDPTGQAVVDHADYVCFTGSTATGRRVAQTAARRLVGASLELGGKNTLYVAADADLRRAVAGAVKGCFTAAGQLCISAERVVVHEAVYDEFVPRFVDAVSRMRLSTGLHWGADMGSLVSEDQKRRVLDHIEDAVAKGARVLTGGRPARTSARSSSSPPSSRA